VAMFTLGYEGLDVGAFCRLLTRQGVETVIDVRELPLSRKPGFAKRALAARLEKAGIAYVHSRELGCPRPIRDRLRKNSDWSAYVRDFSAYLRSVPGPVSDLARAARRTVACLVCFEADHARCHRSLVARAARRAGGPEVIHLSTTEAVPDAPLRKAA
jgi:uncharacterized protein (DUF488 family)